MIGITLPFFPPSTNHAYFTRGHIRKLSTEGKRFKNEVQNYLLKYHPNVLAFFQPNVEYEVLFILFYEADTLYNKGWPKDSKVPRHKKNDATNRIKLLEDAVVSAAGHDDRQHWSVSVTKSEALVGQDPYVEMWVWHEDENGPIARFVATRTTQHLPGV